MIFRFWDFAYLQKEAEKIISLLNIVPGFQVAEIGAGTGELAEILAKKVGPTGFVFATEYDEKKLEKILKRIKKHRLTNFQTVLSKGQGNNLPEKQFDAILMKKVFHHFSDPKLELGSFYEYLKPDGKLLIADFEPKWYLKYSAPKNIPKSFGGHGIFKRVLIGEVLAAGFVLEQLDEKFSAGGMYCAVFIKK